MAQLERYDPRIAGRIRYEHFHRYAFAADLVADATVLDIACGEGYGSVVLSRRAARVVGVDIDPATVAEATRRYGAPPRLSYVVGEAGRIPFPDASFDVVVSMETIEHLEDSRCLIAEVRRVLRPDGLLILSSPDKEVYNRGRAERNMYHFNELEAVEFVALLGDAFKNTRLFGQRMILASAINATTEEGGDGPANAYRGFTAEPASEADFHIGPGIVRPRSAEYLIGLASDGAIPTPAARHSIFLMRDDDLWQEHDRVLHWASGLHKEDEILRSRVRDLEASLEDRSKDDFAASVRMELDHMRQRAEAQAEQIQQLAQGSRSMDWQVISSVLANIDGASADADAASVLQALTRLAVDSALRQRRVEELEASLAARATDHAALQRVVDTTSQAIALHAEFQNDARHTEAALRRGLEERDEALAAARVEHADLIAAEREAQTRAEAQAAGSREEMAVLRRSLAERDEVLAAARAEHADLTATTRAEQARADALAEELREESAVLRRSLAERDEALAAARVEQADLTAATRAGQARADAEAAEAREERAVLRRSLAERDEALAAARAEQADLIAATRAGQALAEAEAEELREEMAALRRSLEENDAELFTSRQLTRRTARSADQDVSSGPQSAALRRACEMAAAEHRRCADQLAWARETVRLPPRPRQQRAAIPAQLTSDRLGAFRRSGLFIDDYYAREAGLKDRTKAWADFSRRGCKAGVSCNPLLSTSWLSEHVPELPVPSATFAAVTAPQAFEDVMHPLFDPKHYVEANGIDLPAGVSPLSHYMIHGRAAGLSTHPLIDTAHLREVRPGGAPFDLVSYVSEPALYRLPVHPLFDADRYLETNPDVAASGMNPLTHYVFYGWRENRTPNRLFDNFWYLASNDDVAASGVVPLAHYVSHGAAEGRDPHPLFEPNFYLRTYGDIVEAGRPAYAHFLQYGWSEGRFASSQTTAIAQTYEDWPRTRILDDILTGRMNMSDMVRVLPAPKSLYGWSQYDGQTYYLKQKLRDYIIDRFGEDLIDLYVNLFAVIERYEDRTEAFDTGGEIEEIAARIKSLAVTQRYLVPAVSIIVPVYNNLVYTLTCLLSILETSTTHSFEIIVADDVSSDRTAEVVGGIGGRVRHLRHEKNLGFLHNCNAAAEAAAGRYLVFLNNDTVVLPGWLDHLITPMEIDPSVGLTGSKLLNGDGTLQEAGGIFWRDGTAWNFGRGQDPRLPEFNYAKDIDYISGASIALPRVLWRKLGGFDPIYTPAYCEDSDIAFRVRAMGYRTRYQPHSMLVHHEGRSHGRDLTSGIKAYQVANEIKLRERWRTTLERDHEENAQNVFLARDRSRRKPHILVVDHYVPQRDRDAGSRTVYLYLRLFLESGFAVTFWADNLHEDPDYTPELQQMGIEVIYSHAYANRFPQWLAENGKYLDYALLSRPHIAIKYIDEIAKIETIKKIYYGHDLHFKRIEQEYKLKGDANLLIEAEKFENMELKICNISDVVLYPSFEEIEAIRHRLQSHVVSLAIPMVIFNETELTTSETRIVADKFRDPFKLMFIGGFSHSPNVDGILWFVREVFPLLRKIDQRFHLAIAGSNAPDSVRALVDDDIDVLGRISDQALHELYRTSGMAVVPLRYGAGVKGKVIEAMSHGLPVAMTEVGAQGIPPAARIGFVGDTPQALTDAIVHAVNDPVEATARTRRAVEFLRTAYSERAARELLAPVVPELAEVSSVASKRSTA